MNLVVLGRPGSGKGTQAARLAAALDLELLTTSDLLRDVASSDVQEAMGDGGLVDDTLVSSVVRDAVAAADRDVLLDGFPRTVAQCEALAEMFGHDQAALAVEIDVPAAEIAERLERRLVCGACGDIGTSDSGPACPACGTRRDRRDDDAVEVVLHRLGVYERDTAPVTAWFERRGCLVRVDGEGTADEVFDRLLAAVSSSGHAGVAVQPKRRLDPS